MPLVTGINDYISKGRTPFHTPGHKGGRGLTPILSEKSPWEMDVTEVPGLDDLHNPSGIIAKAQENCARWVGALQTFFLVNGASVGIQASILASTRPGDTILIPRNAHKSVVSGLILSGARPKYYLPQVHPDFGLPLGQPVEQVLQKLKSERVEAVFALYPTYFGTVWPIEKLRAKWQGTIIVDEAHGAHFPFSSKLPPSSLSYDVDLVVQSTHKTLSALTQGAVLHTGQGGRINGDKIRQALTILQTTSPSYLIMASLETAMWDGFNKGESTWSSLVDRSLEIKTKVTAKGLRVLNNSDIGTFGIYDLDPTKFLIRVSDNQGPRIANQLAKDYGIQAELWDNNNILFLLGSGDNEETLQQLERGLLSIDSEEEVSSRPAYLPEIPMQVLTPREAFFGKKRLVPLPEAVGSIAGETLCPYPPGVPVIVPGEVFSKELVDYIEWSVGHGIHWHSTMDLRNKKVMIIETT